MAEKLSKKHLGLIYAEIDSFFREMLSKDGYIGFEICPRGNGTDIILRVVNAGKIIGEKGKRIRELTALIERKFEFKEDKIRILVDQISNRILSAAFQCGSLRYKLSQNIPVRRAAYSVIKSVMDKKACGVEVEISGKIRGQRAKSMKFVSGIMIHSGEPAKRNIDKAIRCVFLKQGVLGIKVKINKNHDPSDPNSTSIVLPDHVVVFEPKEIPKIIEPYIKNEVIEENHNISSEGKHKIFLDFLHKNSVPVEE